MLLYIDKNQNEKSMLFFTYLLLCYWDISEASEFRKLINLPIYPVKTTIECSLTLLRKPIDVLLEKLENLRKSSLFGKTSTGMLSRKAKAFCRCFSEILILFSKLYQKLEKSMKKARFTQ